MEGTERCTEDPSRQLEKGKFGEIQGLNRWGKHPGKFRINEKKMQEGNLRSQKTTGN